MTPEELEHRLTTLEERFKSLEDLQKDVHDIIIKFNKYESKWGTLIMVGTAIWAVFATFKDQILSAIGHSGK